MKYKFKVIRKTRCIDEHTVTIDACSEEEARKLIRFGDGEYISLDRDELEDAEITEILEAS